MSLRHSVRVLTVLGAFATSSAQSPLPEAFTPRHIQLDIAIDYAAERITGFVTLELENWTTRGASSVSLLMNRLMDASAVKGSDGSALRFAQDVVRNSDMPMRQVTQVRVQLPREVAPGERVTIRVNYAGNLVGYSEVGWLYVRDRIDTAFTIIREDALAFPMVGGLSFGAWREMPPRQFTYDASVRVPVSLLVATGGVATRQAHGDGTATWRYVTRSPAPFLNISVAPFDTIAASGVRLFYLTPDSLGARRVMAATQTALTMLAAEFGPLRAGVDLTISEIPDGWGSQADLVAGIIQSAAAFRDPGRLGELYHELAHLWNVRDLDKPSPRWNEGFATFMQDLLRERVDGWTGRPEAEAYAIASLKRALAADSSLRTTAMVDYGRREMTDHSYRVGGLMFATLYELLGARDFNRVIGGYYAQFAKGGSTREFTDFASGATGKNLARFFDDWVYTTRWTARLQSVENVPQLALPYR